MQSPPLANSTGLCCAISFNGHEGWVETFRPYLPPEAWLEEAGRKLARLNLARTRCRVSSECGPARRETPNADEQWHDTMSFQMKSADPAPPVPFR